MLRDSSTAEKFCRSGTVKFDEKSKIDNSTTLFQSNTHHLDEVLINLGFFFDG